MKVYVVFLTGIRVLRLIAYIKPLYGFSAIQIQIKHQRIAGQRKLKTRMWCARPPSERTDGFTMKMGSPILQ